MPITLGQAFVRVRPDTAQFEQEASGRLSGALKKTAALAAAVFASSKVKQYLSDSTRQASNLNEAVNVVNLTFRQHAKGMDAFFKNSATTIGLSEAASRQAAANIGGLLNNMKFSRAESAKWSQTLLTLGADMGSAFNKDPAAAVQAIGAALRGETEPIRAFNVSVSQAAVQAKALSLGLVKAAVDQDKVSLASNGLTRAQRELASAVREHGASSDQASKKRDAVTRAEMALKKAMAGATPVLDGRTKAQATLALILEQTAYIPKDFSNTADQLANKERIAAASAENLKSKIGTGLLPVQLAYTTLLADRLLPAFAAYADDKAPKVAAASQRISDALLGTYDLLVKGDFTTAFSTAFGVQEDSRAVDVLLRIREAVAGIDDVLAQVEWDRVWQGIRDVGGDGDAAGAALRSMLDSGRDLVPVVQEFLTQMPSLSDALGVGAAVLSFFAEHSQMLIDLMPEIVAGVIAWKMAQLAATVAQVASLPVKVLEWQVNRQLVASNRALIASRNADTGATVANTTVTNVGVLTRIRGTLATVAHSVASRAAATATAVMTGAQWLLNAALTANPVGLVIAAIALLIGGLVLAYRKSETFRMVVDALWAALKVAGTWIVDLGKKVGVWIIEKVRAGKEKLNAFLDAIRSFKLPGWVQRLNDLIRSIVTTMAGAPGKIAAFFDFGKGDGPGRAGASQAGGRTLARVRSVLPAGAYVTSTYRTSAENRAIGGSPTSYHLDRSNPAVDIGGSTAVLDAVHARLAAMGGWRELLWRTAGHWDHVHVAHTGGVVSSSWPAMPGWRSDERPARLQVGETVVPKGGGGPLRIEGTLDLGGGLVGMVRGVVHGELAGVAAGVAGGTWH